MTDPVIARRCPKCGASIREAALFCPQCGNGLSQPDSRDSPDSKRLQPSVAPDTSQAEERTPENAVTLGDTVGEPRVESRKDGPLNSREQRQKETQPLARREAAAKARAAEKAKTSRGKATRGAVGAQIQRATTLARDVEGDVMHRARKVREISSVVLDEAGYDPSLRFVLVAAVLFLLFLIIVLLNRFIT
jgi:hypothetical protein